MFMIYIVSYNWTKNMYAHEYEYKYQYYYFGTHEYK